MTKTYSALQTELRNTLGDAGGSPKFSDAQIGYWVNEAIAVLSHYFSLIKEYEVACATGTKTYDLESNFLSIFSVEYPTGEDPPEYLKHRAYTHPDFWSEDGYYDVLFPKSGHEDYPPQFHISTSPTTGETVTITYNSVHNALSDPSDECTLSDHLVHLIMMFGRWKAWMELSTTEGKNPNALYHIVSDVELNATRAGKLFHEALQRALQAELQSAIAGGWRMDRYDGIY